MTILSTTCFVGIDVSKDSLESASLPSERSFSFPNTPEGIERLLEHLKTLAPLWVVIEPTGGYEIPVAEALCAEGFQVTRPHVTRMRYHAKGRGHASKTDRLDALALAHYGQCYHDELRPFDFNPEQETLRALSQRRRQLVRFHVQEKNRQGHQTLPAPVLESLNQHLAWLQEEIERINQNIVSLIEANALYSQKQQRLQTMIGVGPVVSRVLVAELSELGTMGRREIAALVGVRPCHFRSGKWQGKPHIQGGRHEVRESLYMAALAAKKHCPEIRDLYERLVARGLSKKQALIACIHKMVRILNAMLKKGEPYRSMSA